MFNFGSTVWPGLAKVVEEKDELGQVLGKFVATNGDAAHWDGTDLVLRAEEEIGDLLAALDFFLEANPRLRSAVVQERRQRKLAIFKGWHLQHGGVLPAAAETAAAQQCKAYQVSDQMLCPCGLQWDVNDPDAPSCGRGVRA